MKKISLIIGLIMVNIVGAESNRPDNLSLSNFQFGPVNRWSFSHIREVSPTVNIEHDSESIFKLQRSKAFIKNFSIDHEDRLQEIDEIAKNWFIDGLLILKDNEILFEKYFQIYQKFHQN